MKKVLFLFGLILFVLMAGCGQLSSSVDESETSPETEEKGEEEKVLAEATIKVTTNNKTGIVEEKVVEFEEGKTLMSVLEKNFEVEATNEGYITGINGMNADVGEKYAWFYEVNGEMAAVGASEYELQNGDLIEFDMHKWE